MRLINSLKVIAAMASSARLEFDKRIGKGPKTIHEMASAKPVAESELRKRNDKPHIWKHKGQWTCRMWPGSPNPDHPHWFDLEVTERHYINWNLAEVAVIRKRYTGRFSKAKDEAQK